MPARIIAIANQKGGAGKSTATMHLAGALAMENLRVHVADADGQNSATKWSAQAPDDSPFPAIVGNLAAAGSKIHREIEKVFDIYDVILIDCPPNIESVIPASALLVSDLVIPVMQPTMTDLRSLTDFMRLVERSKAERPGLQSRVLINRMKKNSLSAFILGELDKLEIERFDTMLGDRSCYAEGDVFGAHILAQKGVPAAAKVEIKALRDEIMSLLGLGER